METRKHQQQQAPPWPGSAGGGGRSKSGHNSSSSMTQSRFVEGSMNDRVSAAPPPDFLGPNELAAYERQFYVPTNNNSHGGGGPPRTRASFQHYPPRANREFYQRRPLSSSGPSHRSSQPQLSTQPPSPQQDNHQPQLQTRRSGFLAPLWDGVREKLNLSKSKSSSSIGRVFSKDKTPVPSEVSTAGSTSTDGPERQPVTMPPPVDPTAYPTKEEVMESYKNLVASGFFQAHAIQGTRHPLRQGNNRNPAEGGPPVPPHTSHGPPVSLKSFSEHMAYANAQNQRMSGSSLPSIPSGSAVQSGGTDDRVPPPPTRPPPVPAFMRSPQSDNDIPSPQRGTKRGMPIDSNEIETSTVSGGARKLVKKLRRSTSRASVNFTTSGSTSHSVAKPRPSTSSAVAPSVYMSKDTTPRPSMSSTTPSQDPSSAAALANAQNPFYVTAESFSPNSIPMGTRTPPPKRKSKLIKLSSAGKESTGRRIIGTLGFGGLRRVPSSPSKPKQTPRTEFQLDVSSDQAPPAPAQRQSMRQLRSSPVLATASLESGLLPPAVIDGHAGRKSFGDTTEDEADNCDSDAMVIDSPPPVVFQAAVARAVVAPAPSAFHYPQRQRLSRPLTSSGPSVRDSRGVFSLPSVPAATNHHYSLPATIPTPAATSNGNGAGGHRRYPSSSPIRKKPVASPVSVKVLSPPPPRVISKPDTTPTKVTSTKPMSPSSGNVPSARDSGLGHGHGYVQGQSYDYTLCEEMDRDVGGGGGDDGDEDMENCPPPCVPTGPTGANYVW